MDLLFEPEDKSDELWNDIFHIILVVGMTAFTVWVIIKVLTNG